MGLFAIIPGFWSIKERDKLECHFLCKGARSNISRVYECNWTGEKGGRV